MFLPFFGSDGGGDEQLWSCRKTATHLFALVDSRQNAGHLSIMHGKNHKNVLASPVRLKKYVGRDVEIRKFYSAQEVLPELLDITRWGPPQKEIIRFRCITVHRQ